MMRFDAAVAAHEAGHAICALSVGRQVAEVTIEPSDGYAGMCTYVKRIRHSQISPTFGKRLAAQEQRQSAKRTIGLWPAILGLDEWEALAEPHQAKLCALTRSDDTVVIADELRDPADVTHLYKPVGKMYGTRIRT
mgnify:CR=1 FL=1